MLPDLKDAAPLGGPFEILELADGETRDLTVERWEIGRGTIQPRDGRAAKEILILRLHVSPVEKPTEPRWWDVTSQTLMAGMLGYLQGAAPGKVRFTVHKIGEGPRARFTLGAVRISG